MEGRIKRFAGVVKPFAGLFGGRRLVENSRGRGDGRFFRLSGPEKNEAPDFLSECGGAGAVG